ncbi:Hypothetical protein IALB_3023 [Ignavibacterium album JCM 16511]|uniref:SWIM-type domain-containing protein n=1 Tax=Ignavibacterium album (strain DSM 19864 / JCM 16511 / NBRC 101810 / Mat9-16) TaxID=945713 RepID=I0AP19_IGNAJ|nr:hypothetical protein [Ignavibacterium album]AFH50726.1 Hypothetical protein IALB_3023 [Ignavibacterium album JCM 16511]
MKVKVVEEEILIDFTNVLSTTDIHFNPVIKKKNYLIKSFNSIPKKTTRILGVSINPYYFTCSCKDFRAKAKEFPKRDFRRMCKHLFIYLSKYHWDEMDSLTKILLEHKFWAKILNVIEIEINENTFFIGITKESIFIIYI